MGNSELTTSKFDVAAKAVINSILAGNLAEHSMALTHHFAKGVYVRELLIPKGTVLVGKRHKHECINIMLSGDITIYDEGGEQRFNKPFITVAPAGTQKAGVANEDTIWLNIHGTESTDLDVIEKEVIEPTENDILLLQEIRRIKKVTL